jgi:hypothetical protein
MEKATLPVIQLLRAFGRGIRSGKNWGEAH